MIYFDNAATSFPKPANVIREVNNCIKHYCGNPGRSSHFLAIKSSEKIYEARENIAELFNFSSPEHIVFVHNATHGLNLAIKSVVNRRMSVIISDLEHNSVIRPLYKAISSNNGCIDVYNSDTELEKAIIPLIKEDTGAIISTLSSNVTGKVIDPYKLSQIAIKYKMPLILDASQYAGHLPIDLSRIQFDALIAPGHKALFGLPGSGILILGSNKTFNTMIEGGNGYDTINMSMPIVLPERFEAGTPAVPSIIGLSCGVKYILDTGQINIKSKLDKLTCRAYDILANHKNIRIYGAENGIVSFVIDKIQSSRVSMLLEEQGIASRSGLHCAPLIHRKLGTVDTGLVRLSFSCLNSEKELDKLYKALNHILK